MDTKNITDFIVKGINEKKQSQQIIVVTHNPNIVVNTNSEQVIHMEFAGGEINASHSGALQDFEIRDAICDVMEGGREALERIVPVILHELTHGLDKDSDPMNAVWLKYGFNKIHEDDVRAFKYLFSSSEINSRVATVCDNFS